MLQAIVVLLVINTTLIALIFTMFRVHRHEMKEVTADARAYYAMARVRESRAQKLEESAKAAEASILNATSGNSGVLQ